MYIWSDENAIVDGKKIKEWMKSDEGLVDYRKCKFKHNVSKDKEYVIFDLGEYEFDPSVRETTYHNGVDLARVAGCVHYDEPYKGMSMYTAINGDDYVRIFLGSFENVSIKDFVLYFCHLLEGDIYISEINHHVFVKGRKYTKEEWNDAVEELYTRCTRNERR